MRVLAVHHVDLGEAGQLALAHGVLDELLGRDRVGALLLPRRGEGAELALHAADVRLVQVQVLDEVDLVRAAALAARAVGEVAERRAGRRSRAARGRPRSRGARRRRPSRGSGRAWMCGRGWPSALSGSRLRRRATRAPPGAARRSGSPGPSQRSRGPPPWSARGRPSRPRARARPRAGRRRAPRARPRRRARRAGAAASACPRAGRCPRTLPVSIVSPEQSRMSSAIWNAIPRLRPKRPSVPPRPSAQAASKSFPVLSAQRSRYASTVVSGSLRCRRCIASPRARQSARVREHGDVRDVALGGELGERTGEEVVARRAGASAPCAAHTAVWPRRTVAPSIRSSWTSVAMCTSSTATPAATGAGPHRRAEERQQRPQPLAAGRERLGAELRRHGPAVRATAAARRASTSSMYESSPGSGGRPRAWSLAPSPGGPDVESDDPAAEAPVRRRRRSRAPPAVRRAPRGRENGERLPAGTCTPCHRKDLPASGISTSNQSR